MSRKKQSERKQDERKRYDTEAVYHDLVKRFGYHIYRANLIEYEKATGIWPSFVQASRYRVGKGEYNISSYVPKSMRGSAPTTTQETSQMTSATQSDTKEASAGGMHLSSDEQSLTGIHARMEQLMREASLLATIPDRDSAFVPFGDFDTIRSVIKSGQFCPIYIQGHTGCGKTFPVEQACALEKREYIRVPITIETDEDDLIGGFRLKANEHGETETVFELGPVPVAMLRGAIVLLDEIDLAGSKVMCLQPVLEGKPLTIKKLGITIKPQPGFNVVATANTKGRGSDDGKYIGANMQNEAFLERFVFTIEAQYPGIDIEAKILCKTYEKIGGVVSDEDASRFRVLAKWADSIRETYQQEGIEDLIAMRRLVHIVTAYKIFGDPDKAIRMCLNRFDKNVQEKFMDFYSKLKPEPVNYPTAKPPQAAKPAGAAPKKKPTGAPPTGW